MNKITKILNYIAAFLFAYGLISNAIFYADGLDNFLSISLYLCLFFVISASFLLISLLKSDNALFGFTIVIALLAIPFYGYFYIELFTNLKACFIRLSGNATTPGTIQDFLHASSLIVDAMILIPALILDIRTVFKTLKK